MIEVLIALALSSIIIFGMMQNYNNVMRYLNRVREILNDDRKTCLLFNQIERDFSTAFIPPLLEQIKPEKEAEKKEEKQEGESQKKPEDKEKQESQRREKLKIYFMAQCNDNELPKKLNGQRCYPFKSVSFINTNPLQVYGQKRIRVARVLYELVIDKAHSKGEILSYKLYRKEAEDLENFKAKEDELESTKDRKKVVRTHLVADGIKDMFLQYVYRAYKKKDDKKTSEKQEIEELLLDVWGIDKKETYGVIPCSVNLVISFWDEKFTKSMTMQVMLPILSFSLIKDEEKKEKKGQQKAETNVPETKSSEGESQEAQPQQATVQPPAA
jgi:type II secretory pathway component PulJ